MNDCLTDTCFNFTHEAFQDDREAVLERARQAGVDRLIVTGSSVEESGAGIALAERFAGLFATVGVHPHLARDWTDDTPAQLRTLASHSLVRAIGEAGLDYNRDHSPREQQRHAFEQQIGLAAELGMPLFLHQRDAHPDFIAVLKHHRAALGNVVVHCFTGTGEELDDYLALDLHIGITGWICDERRGRHLHELVGRIPRERLMIETDAPYLLPRDLRPRPAARRNEPAFLPHILATIAAHREEDRTLLGEATHANAERFFHLV